MDTDKAYILGLIIGGGIWGDAENVFRIRLPFKQWGSYQANPKRAGDISRDVMKVISPLLRITYGIIVSYDTSAGGIWNILCEGDLSTLRADLERYSIESVGEVRKTANINRLIPELVDDNLKRRFIAGLADTIGSTRPSHRRFNNNKQMVSFEISGFKFDFVCSLCKLLHSVGCYPDQILWNHPNFHCASDPYNKEWKKGFKLRVYLDQYDKFGAFAFSSKVLSAKENRSFEIAENEAKPCHEREIATPSVTCVHCDENSSLLPDEIRGGHYLHNRHVCAVMACEHAPFAAVSKLLDNAEKYVSPFPILMKGRLGDIHNILDSEPIYQSCTFKTSRVKIADLYGDDSDFLFAVNHNTGYPKSKVILAVAFLIAASNGQLRGWRPKGKKGEIISDYLKVYPDADVLIRVPDLLTVISIEMGEYAALVGASNPAVYKNLIQKDSANRYKISVRPITENDLR